MWFHLLRHFSEECKHTVYYCSVWSFLLLYNILLKNLHLVWNFFENILPMVHCGCKVFNLIPFNLGELFFFFPLTCLLKISIRIESSPIASEWLFWDFWDSCFRTLSATTAQLLVPWWCIRSHALVGGLRPTRYIWRL